MLNPSEKPDFPKLEEDVLALWKQGDIFKKSLTAREGSPEFVFYEGPPTANAKPGLHHVIGRVFKDIIPRYKTMRGFHVPRRAGWDTHGLPVEIEVEKELGIKSKPEIERYGIAAFNAKAKESVWKYKGEWERLTERIGFWLDMEQPYITYDNSYIEGLWGVVKRADERGLLYKGHKIVPWCSRCGTALSSHELAQGYKETADTSVYVKFKLEGSVFPNTSVLVWTTTPWTLPGNVALAINLSHEFVRVPDGDGFLIAEKSAAARLGLSSAGAEAVPAAQLIGLSYSPLFDVLALRSEKSYRIYAADFVAAGDGTGVVHTAVMYGEDDYALGVREELPQFHTVDTEGNFTDAVPALAHMRAKNKTTEAAIVDLLRARDLVWKTEECVHEYPFCWRCATPVLYYATDAWFIAMSKLRSELASANASVNWTPAHIKDGRFGEWLTNVKDWALSRARYWGTPLPVWECVPCGTYRVIGSAGELPDMPKGADGAPDLHRPHIDGVVLPCAKCGEGMHRVKDVMDVWFDSGAMPFAAGEYPARYPADYICEAIDQTRGWFYTLMAASVLMGHGAPYKNVTCYSHLLDKAGKKMSKSKGNAVDPWELISAHGIDAVRWYFYTGAIVKDSQNFDEKDLAEARGFLSLVYNTYAFLATYGDAKAAGALDTSHVLDRWLMSRLHETIARVTQHLDAYEAGDAARAIESFVSDLSRWYLRRSRKRPEALPHLRHALTELSKLLAPFTPFFADALYRSLGGAKESVHLEDWPISGEAVIDTTLVNGMAEIRRIASAGLAARATLKIKVRQPLAELRVRLTGTAPALSEKTALNEELLSILADEVNVKDVVFRGDVADEIEFDTDITDELRAEGVYRDLVRMAQGLRQGAGLVPSQSVTFVVDATGAPRDTLRARQDEFALAVHASTVSFGLVSECSHEAEEVIGVDKVRIGIKA